MLNWFSGRRRTGDIQHTIEVQLEINNYNIVVLSLDLVNGIDLSVLAEIDKWLQLILDRLVIASPAVAPPCETWTFARHMEAHQGPAPVRSADQQRGIERASLTEWCQLAVGNMLMMVGMQVCAAHSAAGTAHCFLFVVPCSLFFVIC